MKAYTDLEQSKKLSEILKWKTADMTWINIYDENHMMSDHRIDLMPFRFYQGTGIPAWSLAALLELIPITCVLSISNGHYRIVSNETNTFFHNNPLDAAFEMVCWLKGMNEITCNNCKDMEYCSQSEYVKNNCYKLNK